MLQNNKGVLSSRLVKISKRREFYLGLVKKKNFSGCYLSLQFYLLKFLLAVVFQERCSDDYSAFLEYDAASYTRKTESSNILLQKPQKCKDFIS